MVVRYSNIAFKGVSQDDLAGYLSDIGLDAWVSPTVNEYTILYDLPSSGFYVEAIPEAIKSGVDWKLLSDRYPEGHQQIMVCLSSRLSKKFNCSVLAVWVESLTMWYYLAQNGRTIDEYFTESKSGNAKLLCRALGKEEAVIEVEKILKQPLEEIALNDLTFFFDGMERHEALSRALGIHPCWVVGTNYLCFTGEDDFEAHYEGYCEEIDPTLAEAILMVKRILPKRLDREFLK